MESNGDKNIPVKESVSETKDKPLYRRVKVKVVTNEFSEINHGKKGKSLDRSVNAKECSKIKYGKYGFDQDYPSFDDIMDMDPY